MAFVDDVAQKIKGKGQKIKGNMDSNKIRGSVEQIKGAINEGAADAKLKEREEKNRERP